MPRSQRCSIKKECENIMKKLVRCEGKPTIPKHLAYDNRFGTLLKPPYRSLTCNRRFLAVLIAEPFECPMLPSLP